MNFVSMYILVGILDITELAIFSSSLGVVGRLDAAFTESCCLKLSYSGLSRMQLLIIFLQASPILLLHLDQQDTEGERDLQNSAETTELRTICPKK